MGGSFEKEEERDWRIEEEESKKIVGAYGNTPVQKYHMPKIIFIEPKAPNFHIFTQFQLPRLGTFILATLMKQRGWDAEVIVEEMQKLDINEAAKADLVGISTITSTAPRAYAIADALKTLGKTVIMGGPHVSYLTDEALEHCDFVIRGEGEKALIKFMDAWEGNQNYENIANLSFKRDGQNVHNPLGEFEQNLDTIPFPDFTLSKIKRKKTLGTITIPIQTSRGCPFDCSFCSVTGMFGKQYRHRSTENIIAELKQYNQPGNFFFFYDDNFTANRRLAKDLLRAMIKEGIKRDWSTQVRVDVAKDPELLDLMKQAGCHTVFIGLESVNPESLKAMKKSQTVDQIEFGIREIQKRKIHVHGMFVFGFDEDDPKTVKGTVRFAIKNKLTSVQFLILTPLPGSELYKTMEKEKRIKFCDWSLYDTHHVVYEPKKFSAYSLQKAQVWGHAKFYSAKESVKKIFRRAWVALGIAVYAHRLNKIWKKENKTYLKTIKFMKKYAGKGVHVNYTGPINFNSDSPVPINSTEAWQSLPPPRTKTQSGQTAHLS